MLYMMIGMTARLLQLMTLSRAGGASSLQPQDVPAEGHQRPSKHASGHRRAGPAGGSLARSIHAAQVCWDQAVQVGPCHHVVTWDMFVSP